MRMWCSYSLGEKAPSVTLNWHPFRHCGIGVGVRVARPCCIDCADGEVRWSWQVNIDVLLATLVVQWTTHREG